MPRAFGLPGAAPSPAGDRPGRPDDPRVSLGVLETTRPVVDAAGHVRIDHGALQALAARWKTEGLRVPAWDAAIHYQDANYVLLLDALNFCFWADPGQERWEVEYQGQRYNGYKALSIALRRAVEEGVPLLDAAWLAEVDRDQMASVLRGVQGEIPMMAERVANAREVGQVLSSRWEGRFEKMAEAASGSAVRFVELVVRELSSFRDVAVYRGAEVRLLKRAQILVVDLFGTFDGKGPGALSGLDQLTAFADYKIPQILRTLGILVYSDEMAAKVDHKVLLPAGSEMEVEIRAAMIWAVHELSLAMGLSAYELDWFLWNEGQRPVPGEQPYHRTRTVFY